MLEYDNSAFYYFGISLSVLYLIPSVYYSGKRILFGCFFTDHLLDKHDVRCERELQKIRKLQAEKTNLRNIFSLPFLLNLLVTAVVAFLLAKMVVAVGNDSEIKSFDPFEILGISSGAADREIKKAYRKMSLMYHPDKNPGDTIAEGKFMLVAKAYESLTDEAAKENYEKYGNPDGRQALQLSIGLPTFLLNAENHSIILFIYLMGLVVVIPSCVALWYSKSKKYGDSMIMYDTYGFYNFALSEHAHIKMLPEILAGSAEIRELSVRDSDKKELTSMLKHFKANNLIAKVRYEHPAIIKANLLFHAHHHRYEISPTLRADLNTMLKKAVHLVDGMLEISTMKSWLQTTINIVEYQQLLTQGLWVKDSSLLQLPNFTEAEVKHCMVGKNALRNIDAFIRAEPDARKGMNNFSEEERAEVNRVCGILPNVDVDVKIHVDDEESIAEGDIMTIEVNLTRKHVAEGDTCDLVYAPEFPFPKAERWMVLVGDVGGRLHTFSKITKQDRNVTEKLMMQAPGKKGTYSLDVYVKSDSYLGMDKKFTVKFEVISASELPAFEVHPEDLELDNEPTLFEQMGGIAEDSSDSEDDDDDDDDNDSDEEPSSEVKKNQ